MLLIIVKKEEKWKTRCFCLAAFSGILTTLAIPNEIKETGYSILGFVAYVPLFIALNKLEDKKH